MKCSLLLGFQVVDKVRRDREKALTEKREEVILELNKLKAKATDIKECGDMDQINTYMNEVRLPNF